MKKLFQLIMLCSCCFYQAKAIDSLPPIPRSVMFKVQVKTINASSASGFLYTINDDHLYISSLAAPYHHLQENTKIQEFDYSSLSEVKVKRKGAAGRGLLFGLIGGVVTGAIIGAASYKASDSDSWFIYDPGRGSVAVAVAIIGLPVGGLLGTLMGGLSNKKYLVKGEKKNFDKMKVSLFERVYVNPVSRKNK